MNYFYCDFLSYTYTRSIFFFNFKIFYFAELSEILTVDGVYKLLFAINGELPGPPIVVYEGQTVSSLKIYISKSNFILFFFYQYCFFFLIFFWLNIHIGGWVGGVKGAEYSLIKLNIDFKTILYLTYK